MITVDRLIRRLKLPTDRAARNAVQELISGVNGPTRWGDIVGNIENQADLQERAQDDEILRDFLDEY